MNAILSANPGTFHNKVVRIEPQGNNSLLTGANASGKSTLIDALLTLLVPKKTDRFYNQSSGVEKKGDRTEETYVLGQYGHIQNDGEGTRAQRLRDKDCHSILLASFGDGLRTVTLFQVRWFSGGEMRREFGPLTAWRRIWKKCKEFWKRSRTKNRPPPPTSRKRQHGSCKNASRSKKLHCGAWKMRLKPWKVNCPTWTSKNFN
jgi:uncharacterized protein YPO0396